MRGFDRVGMVFAHPGHELAVAGLLQHYHPQLLFLTKADSGGDTERERLALHGLEQLGLLEQSQFFGLGESDIYDWLFAHDAGPFLELRQRILGWLNEIQPAAIFGDAFEASNIVHDLGRAVLDSAWREYRRQAPCENYELPLVSRTDPELMSMRFQTFPVGAFETYRLTAPEKDLKEKLAEWAGTQRTEAAMVKGFFLIEQEVFRPVPPDRDYTHPPAGLRLHYDEWGRMQVQLGKREKPILFFDHFIPIVKQLPEL